MSAREGRVSALVIIDDVICTGESLSNNVQKFVTVHKELLAARSVPLLLIALCSTTAGENYVRSVLSKLPLSDVDLRICEVLDPRHYAFDVKNGIWRDEDERDRAHALCVDLGARIYRNNPLGFGGQALLVTLPLTTPNNSLPILHSRAKAPDMWQPLFPRLTN